MLNLDSLSQVHNDLNIAKPTIFYFMSDDQVLEVNRDSLNHDYYTDVITFDYESDEDIEENEVVISWDRIQDNSKVLNQALPQELHRICIHALLHLAGYTDESADEKLKMTAEEDRFLNLYCST
ncbi:MAG: rRNA maturation RNase YbeY [Bacteroidia bacterium]|jgi:rRNA maturation RNase YbeY